MIPSCLSHWPFRAITIVTCDGASFFFSRALTTDPPTPPLVRHGRLGGRFDNELTNERTNERTNKRTNEWRSTHRIACPPRVDRAVVLVGRRGHQAGHHAAGRRLDDQLVPGPRLLLRRRGQRARLRRRARHRDHDARGMCPRLGLNTVRSQELVGGLAARACRVFCWRRATGRENRRSAPSRSAPRAIGFVSLFSRRARPCRASGFVCVSLVSRFAVLDEAPE